MSQEISSCALYSLMIAMLLFGTANTIVMKNQDMVTVKNHDGEDVLFNHPFF